MHRPLLLYSLTRLLFKRNAVFISESVWRAGPLSTQADSHIPPPRYRRRAARLGQRRLGFALLRSDARVFIFWPFLQMSGYDPESLLCAAAAVWRHAASVFAVRGQRAADGDYTRVPSCTARRLPPRALKGSAPVRYTGIQRIFPKINPKSFCLFLVSRYHFFSICHYLIFKKKMKIIYIYIYSI